MFHISILGTLLYCAPYLLEVYSGLWECLIGRFAVEPHAPEAPTGELFGLLQSGTTMDEVAATRFRDPFPLC